MIIYELRKPVECIDGISVGVVGENKSCTQQFLIRGIDGSSMNFAIHLRFADGSVNSVIPDSVTVLNGETTVVWNVKKNDIFVHGYFELQLEGRNNDELIFQTEIVTMYADESIPIEDKQYENPNSETLKLRDETQKILTEIEKQEQQIEENAKIISESDLSKKADKANTLAGYGIADAYTKAQSDSQLAKKQNTLVLDSTPTIGSANFVNSDRIAAALSYKANAKDLSKKADRTDVETALGLKENIANKVSDTTSVTDTKQNYPSVEYLEQYYYDFAQTDELLTQKYDAQNVESGSGTLTPYSSSVAIVKSAGFVYQKIGNMVRLNVNAVLNAGTNGNIIFTDLPFVCKNSVNPRELCITNNKTVRIWAINRNSTWLNLIAKDVSTFTQDETLAFTLTYQIV